MEPIRVPRPSPTAFHKNRRISDLLLSQIGHFQHVAQKRSLNIDPQIARDVHTEGGAARYIATVTQALQKRARSKPAKVVLVRRARRARPEKTGQVPATGVVPRIAAEEEPRRRRSKKRATAERATSRKPGRVRRTADAVTNKKSKSRTPSIGKGKSKTGLKVRAKAGSGKRKKS
jgi:cation transport regulator ChaC